MVLCAAANCDHCDCSGGPFLVVFVASSGSKARAWVYSSESGAWSVPAVVRTPVHAFVEKMRGAIVGDEMCCFVLSGRALGDRTRFTAILKYDLGRHCLSVIDGPEVYEERVVLMSMDDGSLGFAGIRGSTLYLWSRKVNPMEDIGWVQYNVIELKSLFATHRLNMTLPVYVTCFAEGINALVVGTHYSTLTLELNSGQVMRRMSRGLMHSAEVFPIMRFYTPVS
ncbi:hypothetical protein EJB05_14317 [Eragrostis curvula]|uniref:F-box associated domain-containing protein n=1 Tax=Eragrostis curvula TaxID=38414 RepID=A0A5J9VYY5_9POAL|nr:hypothetical protein EJB05_14317 [Eragrostis curvula]